MFKHLKFKVYINIQKVSQVSDLTFTEYRGL